MRLLRARVTNYKSIDDSSWVVIDDITCLVGKNESGKTAFLQALAKLNPVPGQAGTFDVTLEYPRKRLNRYKREHDDNPATVVEAVYRLDDAAVGWIERDFGKGCLAATDDLQAGEVLIRKR